MRTQKLLIAAAAALAAGVITSQAQVYSQNIVGYVNLPLPTGYASLANPLDDGNSLTNVIVNTGALDGTYVEFWSGAGYTTYTMDSTLPSGVGDVNDNPIAAPTVNPGEGFFFENNTGTSNTVTVVGTVHVDGAATGSGTVGVTTNTLTATPALNFYSSKLPIGGGLGSVLQLPVLSGNLDGSYVQIPNINVAGNITGFTVYTIDSTLPSGFGDVNDNATAEPVIGVGQSFFINNQNGTPFAWTQSY